MKLTSTLIQKLKRLAKGESIPASQLNGKWVEELVQEHLLIVETRGTKRTYHVDNVSAFLLALPKYNEGLSDLDKAENLKQKELNRSQQAVETGNSKLVKVRSCLGFPVNTYEPITCRLNGCEIVVTPPEGSFLFITDWNAFTIPENVIVIGIENMENFRLIRQQRNFFESEIGSHRFLFVSRYPQSTDLRLWLQSCPNHYVHFGDFDLAGIHIFLTEFYQYLGDRSSFLVPSDIEKRLQYGSQKRYNSQISRFRHLKCDNNEIQAIIDLINKYHRCYDQEGYISSDNQGKNCL